MNNKLQKGITEIKEIAMTSKEKQAVFSHILEQGEVKNAALERIAPVKSPWTIYSFNNWFTAHRAFALTVAIILIVSIGSDGIVQAAKGSLPGDVLYPIKVHVAEPLQEALTFSSVAKAQLKADLTIQRVQEAESLATEGRLDASKQAQISNMIEDQTKDLNASLKAVAATDPIAATDISSGFKKMMDARARKLDALTGVLSNRQTNIVSTSTIKTDVIQGTKIQNQAEQPQNKTKDAIIEQSMDKVRNINKIAPLEQGSPVEMSDIKKTQSVETEAVQVPVYSSVKNVVEQAEKSVRDIGSSDWNKSYQSTVQIKDGASNKIQVDENVSNKSLKVVSSPTNKSNSENASPINTIESSVQTQTKEDMPY